MSKEETTKETENKEQVDSTPEEQEVEQPTEDQQVNNPESVENDEEQREDNTDWQDKYLRISAEFDNYRKRTRKEKADLISFAGEKILLDLLPVIDDLERASSHLDNADDDTKKGFELIQKKMEAFLLSQNVKVLAVKGEPFDTETSEAITKIPVEEKEQKGVVIDVIQEGYQMGDKVIRFAKVVVGD